MADDTNQNVDSSNNPDKTIPIDDQKKDSDLVEKLVNERVENTLKEIKTKLDSAYGSRDEALRKIADFERKEKEENIKKLQEEGKFKEAFEVQLAEERARRESLEKRNVELTRDITVRNSLTGLDFRNDKAVDVAYQDIVGQLIQDDKGVWVHRSGVSIRDFVKAYTETEDNSFLFKPKVSSGSGSNSGTNNSNNSSSSAKKSLFNMSQEEVLKLASEGKLR